MEKNHILSALIISIGVIGASFFLKDGLSSLKSNNRSVTVRGLDEQNVKSDLVVWQLRFKTTGDDLGATQAELDKQKQSVIAFLTTAGFDASEITHQGIRVVDKQANEYGSDTYTTKRYVLSTAILLRSPKVDLAASTQQKMSDLIKAGVALSDDGYCGNIPNYLFTKLNDIKIDMLAKATKNARDAATQFANDANAKVGSIRNATQGYFSISAQDSIQEGSGGGSNCGDSDSIMKKVRVVTTIDYFLE